MLVSAHPEEDLLLWEEGDITPGCGKSSFLKAVTPESSGMYSRSWREENCLNPQLEQMANQKRRCYKALFVQEVGMVTSLD